MKVVLACLADHASTVAQGNKLNIDGIFDRIHAPKLPARHLKMCLVFRLMLEWEDREKQHKLAIILRDEDGKEYQHIDAVIEAEAVEAGRFASANQIIEIMDAVFVKYGRYHFGLKADDEPEVRVPFEVVLP